MMLEMVLYLKLRLKATLGFVHLFGSPELLAQYSLAEIIGLKTAGLFPAIVLPLLLTVILFLGPIAMLLLDVSPSFI